MESVGEDGGGAVMRLEQRGAIAFAFVATAAVVALARSSLEPSYQALIVPKFDVLKI